MKLIAIILVALLIVVGGGGGAAWYLGLGPFAATVDEAPPEEVVLEEVIPESESLDYDAIDEGENEPASTSKIMKVTESFKKKEYEAYDFSKPGDRFKARKQVEIEITEQKDTVSRDLRLSSPEYQQKKLRYESVSRWLGDDGRNVVPTPTPEPEK